MDCVMVVGIANYNRMIVHGHVSKGLVEMTPYQKEMTFLSKVY